MVVQHNLTAMNSNRMLNVNTKTQSKSTEKLSSGYKVNRAADDAAGLSISEKMRKQIRGLTQASANAQDGISMVQTAEGALNEVQDMLQRMNELAVKAANGTLSSDDRGYLQNEVDQIMSEIDRVAASTKFNETYLLNGGVTVGEASAFNGAMATKYVGSAFSSAYPKDVFNALEGSTKVTRCGVQVDLSSITSADKKEDLYNTGFSLTCQGCGTYASLMFTTGTACTVEPVALTEGMTDDQKKSALIKIGIDDCSTGEEIVKKVIRETYAKVGGGDGTTWAKTPQYTSGRTSYSAHNVYFAVGAKSDGTADYTKLCVYDYRNDSASKAASSYNASTGTNSIFTGVYGVQKTAAADTKKVSIHVGADATSNNQIEVELGNLSGFALGLKTYSYDWVEDKDVWKNRADVTTADNALATIDAVKEAIQSVSTQRSRFGAIQNRLDHTINNLDNVVENTTSAESQIRDTDMATEMVRYSNNNILAWAGQAMLAQANQSNYGVMALLR